MKKKEIVAKDDFCSCLSAAAASTVADAFCAFSLGQPTPLFRADSG